MRVSVSLGQMGIIRKMGLEELRQHIWKRIFELTKHDAIFKVESIAMSASFQVWVKAVVKTNQLDYPPPS